MTEISLKKQRSQEEKRAAFDQTTEFARLKAEADNKARDEKTEAFGQCD